MFVFKASKCLEYVIKIPVTVFLLQQIWQAVLQISFLYFFISASVYYQFIISTNFRSDCGAVTKTLLYAQVADVRVLLAWILLFPVICHRCVV